MKGLLLKDWYMLKRYCRSYLLIVAVFLAISVSSEENTFFLLYPMLMSGVVSITLISYDERSRWNVYCNVLPCTRSQQVNEKYILSLLILAACFVLIAVLQLVKMLVLGPVDFADFLCMMELLIFVGVLPVAVLLPVVFRWGVETGRILYYVVLAAMMACGFVVAKIIDNRNMVLAQLILKNSAFVLLVLLSLVLLVISWRISLRAYQTREL